MFVYLCVYIFFYLYIHIFKLTRSDLPDVATVTIGDKVSIYIKFINYKYLQSKMIVPCDLYY